MTKREKKRAWWRERIEQQKTSGLSIRNFCEKNELAYAAFLRWRRLFALDEKVSTPPPESVGFQELMVISQELELSCGDCSIKVSASLDEQHLTRVILALNRAAALC